MTRIITVETCCFNCRWTCTGDNACLKFRVTNITLPYIPELNNIEIIDKTLSILSGENTSEICIKTLKKIFRPSLEYVNDFRKLKCPFCLDSVQLTNFEAKEYPF